ncbi:MAG: hypothetical protein KDI88_03735 [Gammaproteobacteria bacterium]|nr:hypothetical protein [Gammaproteobacteria bacterium]
MKTPFAAGALHGLVLIAGMALATCNVLAADIVIVDRTKLADQRVREVKLQTGDERETYDLQGGLGPAFGITIDEEKNTYVTRQGDAPDFVGSIEVRRHGADDFETLVPADSYVNGGLARPFYPIIRGDTLFVSSWLSHQVLMFDRNTGEPLGAFVDVDVNTGLGEGGLVNPRGIKFGPDGNLYVNSSGSNETLVYDGESGEYLGVFLDTAAHGIYVPCGIVFDPRGRVVIASASQETNPDTGEFEGGFAVFDWDGNRLVRVTPGAVCGLERTPDGRILAGATGINQLLAYSFSKDWLENEVEVLRYESKVPDMVHRRFDKTRREFAGPNPPGAGGGGSAARWWSDSWPPGATDRR